MADFMYYKDWYKRSTEAIKKYSGSDYKLFSSIIASTSPRVDLKQNIENSKKIFNDFIADKNKFLDIIYNDRDTFFKTYKIYKPHYNNLCKVFKHDFNSKKKLILNGNKVENFYYNLIGNLEVVTIDTWIYVYFKVDTIKLNNLCKNKQKKIYYQYVEKIKEIAEIEGLYPAEIQAILWTQIRVKSGFYPVEFTDFLK